MAVCSSCGSPVTESDKFCKTCGNPLQPQSSPAQEIKAAPAPDGAAQTGAPRADYQQRPAYGQVPPYQMPYYPMQPQQESPEETERKQVFSFGGFFLFEFLYALPVIGFILCIIFSCGAHPNQNLKNFSRARLVWTLICTVLGALFGALLGGIFATAIIQMEEYIVEGGYSFYSFILPHFFM